jgi:hypothetical protein
MTTRSNPQPSFWTPLLTWLLNRLADTQLVLFLLQLLTRLPLRRPITGIYQVLNQDIELELCDAAGEKAVYRKRQTVRFLQDHIVAFEDKAWGDGNIFADYRCSPGFAVDRYRDGHRYRVLISLRTQKRRGDVEEFLIERTIRGGFKRSTEDLQMEIDHQTEALSLAVTFPVARPPKRVWLIEQNTERQTELGPAHFQQLPDGRQRVRYALKRPKRYEAYLLRWQW